MDRQAIACPSKHSAGVRTAAAQRLACGRRGCATCGTPVQANAVSGVDSVASLGNVPRQSAALCDNRGRNASTVLAEHCKTAATALPRVLVGPSICKWSRRTCRDPPEGGRGTSSSGRPPASTEALTEGNRRRRRRRQRPESRRPSRTSGAAVGAYHQLVRRAPACGAGLAPSPFHRSADTAPTSRRGPGFAPPPPPSPPPPPASASAAASAASASAPAPAPAPAARPQQPPAKPGSLSGTAADASSSPHNASGCAPPGGGRELVSVFAVLPDPARPSGRARLASRCESSPSLPPRPGPPRVATATPGEVLFGSGCYVAPGCY
eukprot:scaffold1747_cov392-Prasinococcus_capsulatus_cf.AAC.3